MKVQLFRVCPRGNGGNPVFLVPWSSTSTMSMLKLANISATSILSFPLHRITSGLTKPPEMKEKFNGGISSLNFLFTSR